jgi:hypothetical protein
LRVKLTRPAGKARIAPGVLEWRGHWDVRGAGAEGGSCLSLTRFRPSPGPRLNPSRGGNTGAFHLGSAIPRGLAMAGAVSGNNIGVSSRVVQISRAVPCTQRRPFPCLRHFLCCQGWSFPWGRWNARSCALVISGGKASYRLKRSGYPWRGVSGRCGDNRGWTTRVQPVLRWRLRYMLSISDPVPGVHTSFGVPDPTPRWVPGGGSRGGRCGLREKGGVLWTGKP